MFKTALGLISVLSSFSLFAKELPPIVDLSYFPTAENGYLGQGRYSFFSELGFDLGVYAFNYAPEITPFLAKLKKEHSIDTVVETGTSYGGSTVVFSLLFDEVHTIEVIPEAFDKAKKNLSRCSNVQPYLGHSTAVLPELCEKLQSKRVLFYLDAHWYEDFPLLEEIKIISKTHRDRCILVIDDFKVPGRSDVDYDQYPRGECSFEYIESALGDLFSHASVHFLIPKNLKSRAKLVVIPQGWNH